jgi:hypothetical protein
VDPKKIVAEYYGRDWDPRFLGVEREGDEFQRVYRWERLAGLKRLALRFKKYISGEVFINQGVPAKTGKDSERWISGLANEVLKAREL